jgi:hypothetical protein
MDPTALTRLEAEMATQGARKRSRSGTSKNRTNFAVSRSPSDAKQGHTPSQAKAKKNQSSTGDNVPRAVPLSKGSKRNVEARKKRNAERLKSVAANPTEKNPIPKKAAPKKATPKKSSAKKGSDLKAWAAKERAGIAKQRASAAVKKKPAAKKRRMSSVDRAKGHFA